MEPESSLPYSQVPATPSNFLKNHLNIILPSTSGSPQWPLSLRFPHQHPVHPFLLPHTRHMPAHLILLDCADNIYSHYIHLIYRDGKEIHKCKDRSICHLSSTELVEPHRKKFLGTPL